MLLTLLILVALLVVVALAALVVVVAPHVRALRRRRVIVNLRSGPSLTGVVLRDWGARVELGDAQLHDAGQARSLDGRAVAWKSNIEFVQVLPPVDPSAGGGS